jgi:hypothetical protein
MICQECNAVINFTKICIDMDHWQCQECNHDTEYDAS